jgi:hypothetical protein
VGALELGIQEPLKATQEEVIRSEQEESKGGEGSGEAGRPVRRLLHQSRWGDRPATGMQSSLPFCSKAGLFPRAARSTLRPSHLKTTAFHYNLSLSWVSSEAMKCLEKEKRLFPQVRGKHAGAFSSNINQTRRCS